MEQEEYFAGKEEGEKDTAVVDTLQLDCIRGNVKLYLRVWQQWCLRHPFFAALVKMILWPCAELELFPPTTELCFRQMKSLLCFIVW